MEEIVRAKDARDSSQSNVKKNNEYIPTSQEINEAISTAEKKILLNLQNNERASGVDPRVEVVWSTQRFTAQFFDNTQSILVLNSNTGEKVSVNLRSKFPDIYTVGASIETIMYIWGKKSLCSIRNEGGILHIKLDFVSTEISHRTTLGYIERVQNMGSIGLKIDWEPVTSYTKKVYWIPENPSFDKNIPSSREFSFEEDDGLFYLVGVDEGTAWLDKNLVMINPHDMKLNQWYPVKDLKYNLPLQIRLQLDNKWALALHVWPSDEMIQKYFPKSTEVNKPSSQKPWSTEKPGTNTTPTKTPPEKTQPEKPTNPIVPPVTPRTPEVPKDKNKTEENKTEENNAPLPWPELRTLMTEKLDIGNEARISFEGREWKLFYKRVRGIPDDRQDRVVVVYRNGAFSIRVEQKYLWWALPYKWNIWSFSTAQLSQWNQDVVYWWKVKIWWLVTAKREGDALRIHRWTVESNYIDSSVESFWNWILPFDINAPIRTISGHFHEQRETHLHEWVDISMPEWQSLYAAWSGTVVESYVSSSFGDVITIDHGNWLKTRYAHLQYRSVNEGQRVIWWQQIGISGNTGESTGAHLHLEVIKNWTPVNPARYFDFTKRDKNNELNGVRPERKNTWSTQTWAASFYNSIWAKTASGELYDSRELTAAHPTLPFGTKVKVSRIDDPNKSVVVRINDRGPYVPWRIIDLSVAAAEKIGIAKEGKATEWTAQVKIEVVQ